MIQVPRVGRRGWGAGLPYLFALALVCSITEAEAKPDWMLVLPSSTDGASSFEAHRAVIERALRVEIQDMVVRGRETDSKDQALLAIAVRRAGESVVVQVWDRGEDLGTRVVSASGPPAVWARRIALAVSELGRELSRRRELAFSRARAEEARKREAELEARAKARVAAPRLVASAASLVIPDHAYFVGPTLGLVLQNGYPWRAGLTFGYQTGEVYALRDAPLGGGAPLWSAVTFGLGFERAFTLSDRLALNLGLDVQALMLHMNGIATVDQISGQRDSYLLVGGPTTALALSLSQALALSLRANVGPVLRGVTVESEAEVDRVRGYFVGISLGVEMSAP